MRLKEDIIAKVLALHNKQYRLNIDDRILFLEEITNITKLPTYSLKAWIFRNEKLVAESIKRAKMKTKKQKQNR